MTKVDVPPSFSTGKPTRVARSYPLPVPDDYVPFPRSDLEGSVVSRFEAQVARHADRLALRTGLVSFTYEELNTVANRAARRLLALPAAKDVPVAILMDQDDPAIGAILGILKAGQSYVALDPADTAERLGQVLAKAGAQTVVTTAARLAIAESIPGFPFNCLVWEELNDGADDNLELALGPDTVAAVFFTSGSTGEPKGVVRDHGQFLYSAWANTSAHGISPSDRNSLCYSPGFAGSVANIYDAILNGATLCGLNPHGLSPSEMVDWVRRERITHFNPSVGLWRQLVTALPKAAGWPDLRLITLGGEAIYGQDVRQFQSRFGVGTVLHYSLAMTEAGVVSHGYIDHTTEAGDGAVLVGYALPDKDIIVLDENDVPLPDGQTGRLAVTSAYLGRGYWQTDEGTANPFRPAADGSARRTFLTSDLGRLHEDGCLEYYGREDSIVKVRGYRVDIAAVEAALHGHANVAQAAVVTRKRADSQTSLVAYLVGEQTDRTSDEKLRAHLARLVSHFMIPEQYVWLESLPLTARGKINRHALTHTSRARPGLSTTFVAPRTHAEQCIAAIWAELLEMEKVGANDGFFDLGGDSLLAMTMVQRVERRLDTDAPPNVLRASTVAEMAQLFSGNLPLADAASSEMNHARRLRFLTLPGRGTPRRLMRSWMKNGPVWNGHALSYGVGIRLQRALATQMWLFRIIYPHQLEALQKWRQEPGIRDHQGAATISVMANTWKKWRSEALRRPNTFDKWIVLHGDGRKVLDFPDDTKGVVFAMPHACRIMPSLQKMCELKGRETAIVVNDYVAVSEHESNDPSLRHTHRRARQLWEARQVLLRKGVVFIAGDGKQGTQSIPVPFWGRQRPFQIGAAWLAVMHDADLVPVFVTMDNKGRIHVDITAPLKSNTTDKEERVAELTQQYGSLYAQRWPDIYPSVGGGHLIYNYEPPGTT